MCEYDFNTSKTMSTAKEEVVEKGQTEREPWPLGMLL